MEKIFLNDIEASVFEVGASRFIAQPEMGARLMRWDLDQASGEKREILYWKESCTAQELPRARGGNPILFPFCARSFHKGAIGFWQGPDREVRPMLMHGFARDEHFVVEELKENGFTALLEFNEHMRESYPYHFKFRVQYEFSELELKCVLSLENLEEQPIPWSAGHHFYFMLPWHEKAMRGDYSIELAAKKAAYQDAEGGLVMEKCRSSLYSFDDPAIINRIHTELKRSELRFGPKNGEEYIRIRIGTDPVPPRDYAVVTWTEAEDSPFFCVEPWMGPPNSPEHKRGYHWVGAGETDRFEVFVSLV